jgi:hypothetical protein
VSKGKDGVRAVTDRRTDGRTARGPGATGRASCHVFFRQPCDILHAVVVASEGQRLHARIRLVLGLGSWAVTDRQAGGRTGRQADGQMGQLCGMQTDIQTDR